MKNTPQSPSELRDALAAIFPALPRDFGAQGESVFEDAGPTCQSVLHDFSYFFAKDIAQFTDRQLTRFAKLVVRSLEGPAPLAGAMETFLEQARQLKVNDRIEPFLASARKGART